MPLYPAPEESGFFGQKINYCLRISFRFLQGMDCSLKGMGNLSADYRVGRHAAVMNSDPTAEN